MTEAQNTERIVDQESTFRNFSDRSLPHGGDTVVSDDNDGSDGNNNGDLDNVTDDGNDDDDDDGDGNDDGNSLKISVAAVFLKWPKQLLQLMSEIPRGHTAPPGSKQAR